MKPPPGARITVELDVEGRKLVRWAAVSQQAARVWAAVLLAAAALCAYAGRDRLEQFRLMRYGCAHRP